MKTSRFIKRIRRSPWRRPGTMRTGIGRRFVWAWQALLFGMALTLAACAPGQGPEGWGWPQGKQNAPEEAAPLQTNNFSDRLAQIQKDLDNPQSPWQSGPDQPNGQNEPVEKTQLGPERVKVALLVPLSGNQKALGESMMTAGQLALQDLRARNVELLPRDSGPTASSARAAARDAVKDNAKLILGPVFADQVKAASEVTRGAHVPLIGFTTDVSAANGDTFVMGFLPTDQAGRILAFAAERGASDVILLAPDNGYGKAVAKLGSSFQSVRVTPFIVDAGDTPASITARVKSMMTPKTAIMYAFDGAGTRRLLAGFAASGITPKTTLMLGTGLLDDPQLATARDLENVFFASAPLSQRERFQSRYKSIAGKNPERLASLAYDATALAAVVAGSSRDQLNPIPAADIKDRNGFAGIDGIFRFEDSGVVTRGLAVLTWTAGNLREVAPAPNSF